MKLYQGSCVFQSILNKRVKIDFNVRLDIFSFGSFDIWWNI